MAIRSHRVVVIGFLTAISALVTTKRSDQRLWPKQRAKFEKKNPTKKLER